jgi:ribonucleoside-diphosphate reductase alpha chain
MTEVKIEPRLEMLPGNTYKTRCGCGSLYITITELDNKPAEVFINLGKGGTCANIMLAAMGRDISHGLRYGVPLEEFSRTHFGSRCDAQITSIQNKGKPIFSCLDAIAKVFIEYLKKKYPNPPGAVIIPMSNEKETPKLESPKPQPGAVRLGGLICEVCGGPVVMESSCEVCKSCGHSQRCS